MTRSSSKIAFGSTRAVAGLMLLAAVLAGPARAVGASVPTASASDPANDNGPGHDPRGDVVSIAVSYGPSITVSATTVAGLDPASDPNWRRDGTELSFRVNIDNDNDEDFLVRVHNDGSSSPHAEIIRQSSPYAQVCAGNVSFSGTTDTVRFPAYCIADPATVAVAAELEYNTATTESFDQTTETPPIGAGQSLPAPPPRFCGPESGYWIVSANGAVAPFGAALHYGAAQDLHLAKPVVGMAGAPEASGYWLAAADGGVFAFGDARFRGSAGGLRLNAPVVGMAATATGNGYWLAAADGGVFAFGDARFRGSAGGLRLNAPVVGMAATATGNGYWLAAADGGVFAFGDARFRGSAGGLALNAPVVGMAATATGNGYWLVAADGGVFAFGDATFHGSLAGIASSVPIVGMSATPAANGYELVGATGAVYGLDAPSCGDLSSGPVKRAVVGITTASTPL